MLKVVNLLSNPVYEAITALGLLRLIVPLLNVIRALFLCVLFSFTFGDAFPQSSDDLKSQDTKTLSAQEIKVLKIQTEKTYKAELEDCYQKFAVNSCKNSASQKRINELSRLRGLELEINTKERAQKAEQFEKESQLKSIERDKTQAEKTERANIDYQNRLKENKEKTEQHKTKARALTTSPNEELNNSSSSPTSTSTSTPTSTPITSIPPSSDARLRFEAKQKEALKHKEEVQKRIEEKARSKSPSQPSQTLPTKTTPASGTTN